MFSYAYNKHMGISHVTLLGLLVHPYTKDAAVLPRGAMHAGLIGGGTGAALGAGYSAYKGDPLGKGALTGAAVGSLGGVMARQGANNLWRAEADRLLSKRVADFAHTQGLHPNVAASMLAKEAPHTTRVIRQDVENSIPGLWDTNLRKAYLAGEADRVGLADLGDYARISSHVAGKR